MKKRQDNDKKDKLVSFEGYYDGIPEEITKMTSEELEEAILEEKKKCDKMTGLTVKK